MGDACATIFDTRNCSRIEIDRRLPGAFQETHVRLPCDSFFLFLTSRAAAESNGGVSAFKTFSDFSLMGDF